MSSDGSLLSPDWHRVAGLKPRLKPGLRIERQRVRGQRWHVLLDESTGRSARLNPRAYAMAARLDGRRTLGQLWALSDAHTPSHEDPPGQDDVITTVRALHQSGLIVFDDSVDFGALAPAAWQPGLSSPQDDVAPGRPPWWMRLWSWRVPLVDPSNWLARRGPLARLLFSRTALAVWLLAMGLMAVGLVMRGPQLWREVLLWLDTPGLVWQAGVAYPLMKALHEASHALAVRRWNGRVTEAGITFMMFMPVPYVDASAASAFPRRAQRVTVSAAGIMAELAVAASGFALWWITEEGWAHNLGMLLWFLGGVSTVLFNANPLQRLDGYHVMADACQLPNLATRSRQWWQWRWQRWLSGNAQPADTAQQGLVMAPGERAWLIGYAPLAWLYMVGLGWVLSMGVGRWSAPLGVALAVAWGLMWVLWPALRWLGQGWRTVLASSANGASGGTRGARRLGAVVGLALLVSAAPWPDATVVQGVVWPPEQAMLRSGVDGFVQTLHVRDGASVKAGELLVTLRNPKLQADHAQRLAQLAQAEQDQFAAMNADLERSSQASEEIHRLQADVQRLQQQLDALTLRAGTAGRVVLPGAADLSGRYVRQGELLGHVITAEPMSLKIAVREADAPEVGQQVGATPKVVSVRLASQGPLERSAAGRLWRDAQGGSLQLPSAALSTAMGGDILTAIDDPQHRRALRPVVLMDIRLESAADTPALRPARLGERAWVRIDRGWSPPIAQLGRWMRHRAAESFNPVR